MFSTIVRSTLSTEEKKEIFTTELLKSGVESLQAIEAASILVAELAGEQLTSEQIHLVEAACIKWLRERKRQDFINEVIQHSIVRG